MTELALRMFLSAPTGQPGQSVLAVFTIIRFPQSRRSIGACESWRTQFGQLLFKCEHMPQAPALLFLYSRCYTGIRQVVLVRPSAFYGPLLWIFYRAATCVPRYLLDVIRVCFQVKRTQENHNMSHWIKKNNTLLSQHEEVSRSSNDLDSVCFKDALSLHRVEVLVIICVILWSNKDLYYSQDK